ncbi:hypothetical protein BD289DRAFT_478795 [Coniella lustricola]|uniref:Uncharacterized protein n=1 Tax=Coniella lustricola TaxID=2025994 RepID=A0A2T3AL19_9PEZI|nr:hypothetical protein BD289DRAFT_478795 [Coniella lustricola]
MDDRKIGALAIHSSLHISIAQACYPKDWALIKLNLDKFTASPVNKVFIDRQDEVYGVSSPPLRDDDDDGFIQLNLEEPGDGDDKQCFSTFKMRFTILLTAAASLMGAATALPIEQRVHGIVPHRQGAHELHFRAIPRV